MHPIAIQSASRVGKLNAGKLPSTCAVHSDLWLLFATVAHTPTALTGNTLELERVDPIAVKESTNAVMSAE